VALLIQERIQDLDNYMELAAENLSNSQGPNQSDTSKPSKRLDIGRIVLGSLQPITTFQQIEDTYQDKIAFKNFRLHLNRWLTKELQVHNLRPQDAPPISFQSTDEVDFLYLPLIKAKTK
jgi:hypothetical protein